MKRRKGIFKKITSFLSIDMAIDLGTANSLVYIKDRGIVINEPSVVAINNKTGQILAIGEEAKKMVGRTPAYITATRPLVSGVISDFEVTEQMLRYFIEKGATLSKKRFGLAYLPRVIIGIPCGVTEVERKAVRDAAKNAGARTVFLIEEPLASAIGARLPIQDAGGNFVVDIGGGTTEVAVISLGGIVTSSSIRISGDKMDQAISDFIKKKYNLAVGEQTAEEIKKKIGTAIPLAKEETIEIKGRDLILGLPRVIKISSNEVCEAISDILVEITQLIKQVLRETPPELSADIMSNGMIVSGGGGLLQNIDELIFRTVGVPTAIAEEPLFCVAKGTGIVLENLETYKKSVMSKK